MGCLEDVSDLDGGWISFLAVKFLKLNSRVLSTAQLVTEQCLFITWPVQNVAGQLLLLSLTEVGQHLFEANINGAEAFYELKMKFEMQNVSF